MSKELRQKLKEEMLECDWSMLAEHYSRGAILVIDEELDLVEVGVALAEDDVDSVKEWQSKGFIRPPSEEEANEWDKDKFKKFARFIVIQPFVVIQKITLVH